jgi:hypothetical protein
VVAVVGTGRVGPALSYIIDETSPTRKALFIFWTIIILISNIIL